MYAQGNTSLPVAVTLEVVGANPDGAEVVTFVEEKNQYVLSRTARDGQVYGVTAISPALVFSTTASGTIPVLTAGATSVQVNNSNGVIKRGDLLTTSNTKGTAMRADLADDHVFAIALEDFGGDTSALTTGKIIAEIGIAQAQAIQEIRREVEKENLLASSTAVTSIVSFVRVGIAAMVAMGGLLFTLYSFRSAMAKGVVSIGRNPRASSSIVALAFGNIIFALILCAVTVFVAIGILILPV